MRPINGWNLSMELDKVCTRVDKINSERAAEAERLSHFVMRISIVLVNMVMLPIPDIPQLIMLARETLPMADLIW
jgi:hypothetical protein